MSSLYIHIESVSDEDDIFVLRTQLTPHEAPVVMVVRRSELDDALLTVIDGCVSTRDDFPRRKVSVSAAEG